MNNHLALSREISTPSKSDVGPRSLSLKYVPNSTTNLSNASTDLEARVMSSTNTGTMTLTLSLSYM